jgi:hypothetical protein
VLEMGFFSEKFSQKSYQYKKFVSKLQQSIMKQIILVLCQGLRMG